MNNVQVIGDIMLDVYEKVAAVRVSPEAPVLIGELDSISHYPGGAANAARNCVALGSPSVQLHGVIGADSAGSQLKMACNEAGIICKFQEGVGPTITKRRTVNHCGQHLLRVDTGSVAIPPLRPTLHLSDSDSLLISDYDKGMFNSDQLFDLIAQARINGCFVVVNGKPKNILGYRQADCLVFNYHEARETLRLLDARKANYTDPAKLTDELHATINLMQYASLEHLVVTVGERGFWHSWNDTLNLVPAVPVVVSDVVGAGDTLCATIAVAGNCFQQTLIEAAKNAAKVVSQRGTATP